MDDKHDARWQIVLGSLNPVYCVLCSFALWLELNLKLNVTAMNLPYFLVSVTTYLLLKADSSLRQ